MKHANYDKFFFRTVESKKISSKSDLIQILMDAMTEWEGNGNGNGNVEIINAFYQTISSVAQTRKQAHFSI